MIPVMQTQFVADKKAPPNEMGNCLQACVASVFELPLESVPHFVAEGDDWWSEMQDWLTYRHNVYVLRTVYSEEVEFRGVHLLFGKSPRGDFKHIIVGSNGRLLHDPHPDRSGLEGDPEEVWIFAALDPSCVR